MKFKWDFKELYDFADRLNDIDKFEEMCKKFVKELARELQEMLFDHTPVKTGQLATGWGGSENYEYKIVELKNSYKVTLYNRVPYAKAVNDGHYSYNQFGGPYIVKNRNVPYTQGKNEETFVFGHFFVEKSILLMENDNEINALLEKEFERWFRWCVNGK